MMFQWPSTFVQSPCCLAGPFQWTDSLEVPSVPTSWRPFFSGKIPTKHGFIFGRSGNCHWFACATVPPEPPGIPGHLSQYVHPSIPLTLAQNWTEPHIDVEHLEDFIAGWWFGTWILFFHILGMSSPQLTNSIIFQRGRSTTNQL